MSEIKYIIIKKSNSGLDYPYIFNEVEDHVDVTRRLLGNNDKVVSAGFVSFDINDDGHDVCCSAYGESKTLKLQSRTMDSEILNRVFSLNGMGY